MAILVSTTKAAIAPTSRLPRRCRGCAAAVSQLSRLLCHNWFKLSINIALRQAAASLFLTEAASKTAQIFFSFLIDNILAKFEAVHIRTFF